MLLAMTEATSTTVEEMSPQPEVHFLTIVA